MILIDTNALIVYILGLIDVRLIERNERTSIYDESDFYDLYSQITDITKLVVLPNVWTELDNLLNNIHRNYKYTYIQTLTRVIKESSENYIKSSDATDDDNLLFQFGITDVLLLKLAPECNLLITGDSKLSDYATSLGMNVFDLVKRKNDRISRY